MIHVTTSHSPALQSRIFPFKKKTHRRRQTQTAPNPRTFPPPVAILPCLLRYDARVTSLVFLQRWNNVNIISTTYLLMTLLCACPPHRRRWWNSQLYRPHAGGSECWGYCSVCGCVGVRLGSATRFVSLYGGVTFTAMSLRRSWAGLLAEW